MFDSVRRRETWVGRPRQRRRWLGAGVVVGLVVAVFHVPATAYPLADLGFPTGWGVAGYAHLLLFLVAAGSGYDRAGVLVGFAAAFATAWWWALPGTTWGVQRGPRDPVAVLSGVAGTVLVVGGVGYLVGAGVRHAVTFVRARVTQAASASKS